MNVLVYGYGNMGSRRGQILADLGHNVFLKDPIKGIITPSERAWIPDVVFICTPPKTHLELAWQHLGKHLFIEKPLATSYYTALDFWIEFKKTGKVGAVGYNWKYHPAFKALKKKKLDKTRFAILEYTNCRFNWGGSYKPSFILETHELELAMDLFGYPQKPSAIERENGFQVWLKNTLTVKNCWPESAEYKRRIYIATPKIIYDIDLPQEDAWMTYVEETKHFMQCIRTGKKPLTTIEDGLRTLGLLEECKLLA